MGFIDLLEALGRLFHVVAISVGVVEERQLLEGFFYGCLVRFLIEAQHFEVLGAGRHCAALLSATGQPRAAQGSNAWIGGLAEILAAPFRKRGASYTGESTQRSA